MVLGDAKLRNICRKTTIDPNVWDFWPMVLAKEEENKFRGTAYVAFQFVWPSFSGVFSQGT